MPDAFSEALQALRPQLLRFARLQLHNSAWAEDAVSETLLAALEKPQTFAGRSQLKTWLIGILKHKLVDQIRRHGRELSSSRHEEGSDSIEDELFDESGRWREDPADWGNPEQVLRETEFLRVLDACVDHLPGQQGRLFLMREWLELDTEEICQQLGITPTNLWVMLHRARLRLRECLQQRWFQGESAMTLKEHGCRQAARLISKRCDASLDLGERLRLRVHLLLCGRCQRFAQQTALMQQTGAGWRAYREQADPEEQDPERRA